MFCLFCQVYLSTVSLICYCSTGDWLILASKCVFVQRNLMSYNLVLQLKCVANEINIANCLLFAACFICYGGLM